MFKFLLLSINQLVKKLVFHVKKPFLILIKFCNIGNMNQNGATVKLTDLTEGQYRFKVTVNGTNAYGEGFGNVTVLPPQRINKPPQVVITPVTQTVKLPNTVAVLDGSASKVSYSG